MDYNQLERKAIHFGATEFGKATTKDKRFYVIYGGKKINFGSTTNNTFIDHHDEKKRKAWRARHSMIKLKSGEFAYKNKNQPEFWSYHLLW
jgi:Family of unknown function (DUF5754)